MVRYSMLSISGRGGESAASLNFVRQQSPGDLHHVFSRPAKSPELRAIFNVAQSGVTADGWHVIFHFAEHSPAAVHAACLRGIPTIVRFGPGHIGVLARGINEEIADDERMLVTGGIQVADTTGGSGGVHSDFVFAGCPHLEAHQTIAHG